MSKLRHKWPIVGLGLFLGLATIFVATDWLEAADPPRPEQWKKVQKAVSEGLPKTAIKELEPIIESALADKAYPEAIKAIAKKISLESNIQGNKPEERITRMEAAIKEAPATMKPVMNAILAEWYWHYFQQNRYRYMQRTATTESPGDDIKAWSLDRILSKIDAQFQLALSAEKRLKAIPVTEYAELLDNTAKGSRYRPTLYDVIAFEALNYYVAPEQAGAKSQDEFILQADSPAFAPANEFMQWQPKTTDDDSRTLRAIHLLQDVMKFHADDKDRTPFLDADLFRLQFVANTTPGVATEPTYIKALERFIKVHAKHELSAVAQARLASEHQQAGRLVKAHKIAEAGVAAYPDTMGGNMCHNIIQQIKSKEVRTRTERVWSSTQPTFEVTYRNLDTVYFRLYKLDWDAESNRKPNNNTDERKQILALKPTKSFTIELPKTIDYQQQTHQAKTPDGIEPGYYALAGSLTEDFAEMDNIVSMTRVWVSDLAVVVLRGRTLGHLNGIVTNATTGKPINNAIVKTWSYQYQNRTRQYVNGPTVANQPRGFVQRSSGRPSGMDV